MDFPGHYKYCWPRLSEYNFAGKQWFVYVHTWKYIQLLYFFWDIVNIQSKVHVNCLIFEKTMVFVVHVQLNTMQISICVLFSITTIEASILNLNLLHPLPIFLAHKAFNMKSQLLKQPKHMTPLPTKTIINTQHVTMTPHYRQKRVMWWSPAKENKNPCTEHLYIKLHGFAHPNAEWTGIRDNWLITIITPMCSEK